MHSPQAILGVSRLLLLPLGLHSALQVPFKARVAEFLGRASRSRSSRYMASFSACILYRYVRPAAESGSSAVTSAV